MVQDWGSAQHDRWQEDSTSHQNEWETQRGTMIWSIPTWLIFEKKKRETILGIIPYTNKQQTKVLEKARQAKPVESRLLLSKAKYTSHIMIVIMVVVLQSCIIFMYCSLPNVLLAFFQLSEQMSKKPTYNNMVGSTHFTWLFLLDVQLELEHHQKNQTIIITLLKNLFVVLKCLSSWKN